MSNNRLPSFEADTDFTVADLDSLIDREDVPVTSQNNQHNVPVANNGANNNVVPTNNENPYTRELLDVLELETKDVEKNAIVHQEFSNVDANGKIIQTQQQSNGNQGQQVTQSTTENNDPYLVAFSLLQDLDMLHVGDNVDLSKIDEQFLIDAREQTLERYRVEALIGLRQDLSHDPYILDLVDYAYQGGTFAELPRMRKMLQDDIDYRTLNLDDEKNQKEIVKMYYNDGLNPNNEKDAKLMSFVPGRIDVLVKDKKLRDEAEAARKHFLLKVENARKKEYERVLQMKQQEEQLIIEEEKYAAEWNKQLKEALIKRNWNEEKKEAVRKENGLVKLKDGTVVPIWEYKMSIIEDNPDLFLQFLDLTSKFDIKTRKFIVNEDKEVANPSTINALLQRIQKKGQDTSSYANTVNNQAAIDNRENNVRVIDPTKELW